MTFDNMLFTIQDMTPFLAILRSKPPAKKLFFDICPFIFFYRTSCLKVDKSYINSVDNAIG